MKAESLALFMALVGTALAQNSDVQPAVTSALVKSLPDATNSHLRSDAYDWLDGMGAETNGLACGQAFRGELQAADLTCVVYVLNKTTNVVSGCLLPSLENVLAIKLIDAQGNAVEKTEAGKKFGQFMTAKQAEEWHDNNVNTLYYRRGGSFFVGSSHHQVGYFSVPRAFQLKQAGEYTLEVRMCLMQRIRDTTGKVSYSITLLPEVRAKVRIQPKNLLK
jgi:hypothetical protein